MLLRYGTHTPIKIFTSSISSNAEQPDTPVIAGITSAASLKWSATWAGSRSPRGDVTCAYVWCIRVRMHTVVGDPWAEWLTTPKRVTCGFHAWNLEVYSDLQSTQHLQIFILTPHNNRLEYSVTSLSWQPQYRYFSSQNHQKLNMTSRACYFFPLFLS